MPTIALITNSKKDLSTCRIISYKSVQVKWWITFVEPDNTAKSYIPSWNKAPGVNSSHVGLYLAIHTLIKSHSRAYHLYSNEFRDTQKGNISCRCGIGFSSSRNFPSSMQLINLL
jgi:beta-glucosidase/6-phospho-beta-glucosidase/beta-galactosidase